MTTFRTDVSITRSKHSITLKTPVLTAGSCFADGIGQRLSNNKFQTLVNPFGVTYNPLSIHKLLLKGISNEPPSKQTFLENNGLHFNYDFHSELSGLKKQDLVSLLSNTIGSSHYFLKEASWIMLTYGTAWVYYRKDNSELVANCHKLPSQYFEKKLLRENEIVDSFLEFRNALLKFNPHIRVILTLSPVRHLKDTLELNSVSKAVLRSACYTIASDFGDTEYFPAYEIMMDDLRDYRFYKSDMLHPSEDAESYIWKKFCYRYMNVETETFMKEWESILAALNHTAFHPSSPAHQRFLKDTLKRLENFKGIVNVEEEHKIISSQLA